MLLLLLQIVASLFLGSWIAATLINLHRRLERAELAISALIGANEQLTTEIDLLHEAVNTLEDR